MFDDAKLKIINSMEERDLINYVWLRSMLLAGISNKNGYLYINDNIPYTLKTLAIEFDRTLEEIKLSYKVLKNLEMIETSEEGIFKVKNWEKHQNVEGLEKLKKQNAERVARHREKKKAALNSANVISSFNNTENTDEHYNTECNDGNVTDNNSNVTVMDKNKKKNNKNKIKKESEREINNNSQSISISECDNKRESYIKSRSDSNREFNNYSEFENISESENKNDYDNNRDSSQKTIDDMENCHIDELENGSERLIEYYRIMTGADCSMNAASLKYGIIVHGEENVKMAIDKAIEAGKPSINYINGILKNWEVEGYPRNSVGVNNSGGFCSRENYEADKNKYGEVKRKKCRTLTEGERKQAECILI